MVATCREDGYLQGGLRPDELASSNLGNFGVGG
jgi:hypothetical protein